MVESGGFRIKFKGFEADKHAIDMRQLGQSLVGFEGLVSMGLISLSSFRFPKRRERFPLVVRAHEPRPGSFEIFGDLAPGAIMLPLVHEAISTGGVELIWRWISWVFLMEGGRQKEADPHFVALMEFAKELNASRDRSEDQQRAFLLEVLDRSHRFAAQSVTPVGPSSDTVSVQMEGRPDVTVVDVPMADAIRSKDRIEVGDMQVMRVRVDGFIHHSRQLKVENPDEPGSYLTAYVRDPLFEASPNVYTAAASTRGWLNATVKPSYKEGRIVGLYIMDAEAIGDESSRGSEEGKD